MRRYSSAKSLVVHYSHRAIFLAVACLILSGCGSGSSSTSQALPIEVDDSPPTQSPVPGVLDDAVSTLQFGIDEDAVLDALFVSPEQDIDTSPASFFVLTLPQFGRLTMSADGLSFRYEPDANVFGEDTFVYAAMNGAEITVSIDIAPVPDAPILAPLAPAIAEQGRLYSVILDGIDNDGDELRYSATGLPAWLALDSRTGVLSGVAQQTDAGLAEGISLTVQDSTGLSDTLTGFTVDVVDVNDPPRLNITQVPRQLFGRDNVQFNVFPDDLDDDTVTISVDQNAAFSVSVDDDGLIDLRVNDINEVLSTELTIIARDEQGAVTREVLTLDLFPRTASGNGTTVSGFRDGRGVHVVILGDGYASDQQLMFRQHVQDVLENIRSDEGIAAHLGGLNIHMIETVSAQSGSDDSDTNDIVDTAFDSAYNCRSIPRLVCADTLKMFEASLGDYPDVDQLILLVNDRRFGGSGNSGGSIAITSAFFPEIALHEMGHSLADLADEYVDPLIIETSGMPPFTEGRYANVSTLSDPSLVPWAHWIDAPATLSPDSGGSRVGVFEGGLYRPLGVYRATFSSRMRDYAEPFGPVNTEQWILRLYTLTDGIRELSPLDDRLQIVSGELQNFSIEPMFSDDVQSIVWVLNGEELVPTGIASQPITTGPLADPDSEGTLEPFVGLELQGGGVLQASSSEDASQLLISLPPGEHELVVTVSDISGRIRVAPPHAGIFTRSWSIEVL